MENTWALPSGGLVFQLICHFHRSWAYSSKSTVWPKMESCFQDRACSVSSVNSTLYFHENASIFLQVSIFASMSQGFPGGSEGKQSTCDAGDLGSIPGLGRSPGGVHGNPLQFSSLENPHGQRSLAGYSPWDHQESDTTEQLSIVHPSLGVYPSGTSGREPAYQCMRHKRYRLDFWVEKIPWRRAWEHTPAYSCLENPMDRGA